MISIVIPLYNKEQSIERTVRSVLDQTYRDFELIIVNDGSTDRSLGVVERLLDEDSRIRIVSQHNAGVSAARNTGIKEATCEYVALIDGDDIWDENCLRELVKMSEDFSDAGMWGVNYADIINGEVRPYNQGLPLEYRGYVHNYFATAHGDIFWTSALMMRKEVLCKVGIFDERVRYSEDMDLWYRIILNAPVCFYNHVYSFYNKDAENRAEQDVHKHYNIYQCWDYYIDKYAEDFKLHPDFARFVGMRVAINILSNNYYFGNEEDRKATDHIACYLPLKYMPFKYTLIFKTPRWLGQQIYRCSMLLKRLKNKK